MTGSGGRKAEGEMWQLYYNLRKKRKNEKSIEGHVCIYTFTLSTHTTHKPYTHYILYTIYWLFIYM